MKNTIGFFILLCCLFLGHIVSEVLSLLLPGPARGIGLFSSPYSSVSSTWTSSARLAEIYGA